MSRATSRGRPLTLGQRIAFGVVPPAVLLGWWQAQALAGGANATAFAPLGAIGAAARDAITSGALLDDSAASLGRALTGLAFGAILGVATGLLLALSAWADRLLGPLLQGLRQVPMIGWLPLIALWLGTGDGSQIVVISLAAFFPALLNTHAGVAHVEQRYLDLGRVLGFTALRRFRLILLPAALPLVLTGLSQSLAFAWLAAIGTEILLGAGAGLGVAIATAQAEQRIDVMLVSITAAALLGFALNQIIRHLRGRLLHWQPARA